MEQTKSGKTSSKEKEQWNKQAMEQQPIKQLNNGHKQAVKQTV